MSDSSAVKALKKYYKVSVNEITPTKLLDFLKDEPDRAFVVVCGSYLEDLLRNEIKARLPAGAAELEGELRFFSFDGPMGSFSLLTKMAYAFGVIENETRLALDDIRQMRNACAHSIKPIDFSTPQLVRVCREMLERGPVFDLNAVGLNIITLSKKQLRAVFHLECVALATAISHGSREEARRTMLELSRAMAFAEVLQPPWNDK